MRRIHLSAALVFLIAATCALWTFRFERLSNQPVWRIPDLRAAAPTVPGLEWIDSPDHPGLRVRVDERNPLLAARVLIPGILAVQSLHLCFRMAARGLIPGNEKWEDGRFIIEWHPVGGSSAWENDPACSMRLDQFSDFQTFVMQPKDGPAVPAIRLEHLGKSGEFEITDLEITVVEETLLWKVGRWVLVLAWLIWAACSMRIWPDIGWMRAACAASIWVVMGIQFVIPGPWKIQRPIYPEFRIGNEKPPSAALDAVKQRPSEINMPSGPLPALGKLPNNGGIALRVKYYLVQARPFLHVLLLFAPAFAMACFAGRNAALFMSVALALLIEAAQVAFGYGFGWDDVLDLACDAAGIGLAVWAHLRLRGFFLSKGIGLIPP